MFKKTKKQLSLAQETMRGINRLQFLLGCNDLGRNFGELAEVDIHFTDLEGLFHIRFFTDIQIDEAEARGSKLNNSEKWLASIFQSQITLYDYAGHLIMKRRVEKFPEGYLIN